jgi:glycosyltransferase involved in cell wall biosynthesis
MRSIFIVSRRTISPNGPGGASAIHYEQLNALHELGHEIHLWHYAYPQQREEFDRFMKADPHTWADVETKCASVTFTTLPDRPTLTNRISNKLANFVSHDHVMNPLFRQVAFPVLKQLIRKTKPDFIWSQHFGATQIATLQQKLPVVYSHHDWLHRIKRTQMNGNGHQNGSTRLRQAEERVAAKVHAVVSGSAVECDQLRKLGCKRVAYIPVSFEPVPITADVGPFPRARLVHLGGMGTTANRVGLERFFEVVWPQIDKSEELWVVGDTKQASSSLADSLSQVKCTGHVKDLTTVLRPFDLHIIPWEHNTGQRTRMVMAFNHAQVVVAVRAAVEGFREAVHDHNCVLLDNLSEMPAALARLIDNPAERKRLGLNARRTFETHFTRASLLPKYEAVIASLGN